MKDIMDVLTPKLGEDLAKDIIAHRKGLKCPLTARGAKSLLKQYELAGDPVAAAEHHLNMGWRGFSHEWMKPKGRGFHDFNNPMPVKQAANYGQPEPIKPPEPLTEEEKARRSAKAAEARALLAGASTSMRMN